MSERNLKKVKGQTDGRGIRNCDALNIQMFIDASVRNGLDTLKTILKFLFKIYTRVRRLSGAAGTAAIQCGVDVTLTFSSRSCHWSTNQKQDSGPFPTCRRGWLQRLHRHWSHTEGSGVQVCEVRGTSQVWSALIISLWDLVVKNTLKRLRRVKTFIQPPSDVQWSCGAGRLSVFHLPLTSGRSSLIQF